MVEGGGDVADDDIVMKSECVVGLTGGEIY